MSVPSVNIHEIDGALGVTPATSGRIMAIVGPSDSGPLNQPAAFGRLGPILDTFGGGPIVEAAAYALERYGRAVLIIRSDSDPGSYPADDAVDFVGEGTSVITVDDSGTAPNDAYECVFEVVRGGTIGVDGITFRWSLDAGRTWSSETALGTEDEFVFPDSGGIKIEFDAGTLEAGDRASFRADAPVSGASDLKDAIETLRTTAIAWESLQIVSAMDAAAFDVVEGELAALRGIGKYRRWVGNARVPSAGESEADYLAALSLEFGAKTTIYGTLCAGDAIIASSVSGRQYRRPVSVAVAARESSLEEHINSAAVDLGPLPGVSIHDRNGNLIAHDETVFPGLDDARLTVLRTFDGIEGVYVNRPRIFAPSGSDFTIVPYRRVLNISIEALRLYLIRRLNRPVRVSKKTGFILEQDAVEIERGAIAVMRSLLGEAPKASGWQFVVSRTDNLLSTKTMTTSGRVIPLGYPEFIDFEIGLLNPAMQLEAV